MSDFLLRLISQAAGEASPIHSRARLPYTNLPLVNDAYAEPATEDPQNLSGRDKPLPVEQAARTEALQRKEMHENTTIDSHVTDDQRIQSTKQMLHPAETNPLSDRMDAAGLSRMTEPEFKASRQFPRPSEPDIIPEMKSGRAIPGVKSSSMATPEAPLLLPPVERRPCTQTFPPPQVAWLPGGQRAPHHLLVQETTEIDISIGRIEISAEREKLRENKQRDEAAKKPLSLDEYLAQRARGNL